MTTLRSRRLETLLGTEITEEALTWEYLQRLLDAQVPEAADLDYKVSYPTQPSDRHKPGGDVAAMACGPGPETAVGAVNQTTRTRHQALTARPGKAVGNRYSSRTTNWPPTRTWTKPEECLTVSV